ncbi:hypothetical protein H5410_007665 [Solanum commersonii]|uniref:Uncharacterized protein n=1 Tax=Solanum commersonii TaxID=4109 RepID=A0A9J6AER2_SOLCO|nr:hypothetical protein H5410_007665 [Solanum commersonii]
MSQTISTLALVEKNQSGSKKRRPFIDIAALFTHFKVSTKKYLLYKNTRVHSLC